MPSWLINMESKSINIKQVIDKIKRHPLLADISMETIVDYTVDFFQIVGLPTAYQENTAVIEITNYKGALPDDFLDMIQVRTTSNPPIYYRYATDTFHISGNKYNSSPFTYKIQGNYIFTSEKDTKIEIAYSAIEVDECGLPVIPDNAKFIRALEAYVKLKHFTILFDLGKIATPVLDKADQEYCWAVGACQSEFNRISVDKAESILNLMKSIFIPNGLHQNGYSSSGNQTMLRKH